jgi:hypothetical protein
MFRLALPRFALLALLPLAACTTPARVPEAKAERGYQGTIQKVFLVVRQGAELPGTQQFIGRLRNALGPGVRQNAETRQYVVRTPKGQILAQSDDEFPVGECVEVIPQGENPGPAFRHGEAQVVRSTDCG